VDFSARERSLHTIEFTKLRFSLNAEARLYKAHGIYRCRGWAQHTTGVMLFQMVPHPLSQTILIFFFLVIFSLISFTVVLTAALICQVLKYLELFSFF